MEFAGMMGGLHAHLRGKTELKRVNWGSHAPWNPDVSTARFGGRFSGAVASFGCDPRACMLTGPHRDSGVQALNRTFNRGETTQMNCDPSAILINYRLVVNVAGDDLLLLTDAPTHDPSNPWAIDVRRLSVGDIFVFHASAGALLKHAAATAGKCSTYAVFDIHLSSSPPNGITPPPPSDVLVCPLASYTWWPDGVAPNSMQHWAAYREERSAMWFLSHKEQREAITLEVAIFSARQAENVSSVGQVPAAAAKSALIKSVI